MTHSIDVDIETRSTLELEDVGVHIYASHPSTQVLCVGYAIDNEPVRIWHPGEPVPGVLFEAASNSNWEFSAHNAAFEMWIWRCILGPKHGFPSVPIEQWHCTMALLASYALPQGLARAAKALNLKHQKDATGARLMKLLAKPRRARKHELADGVYYFDDPERLERNDNYCKGDVEVAREIRQKLPPLPPDERATWLLDQRINDRGFYLDRKLAEAARKIAQDAHPIINAELAKLTKGEVTAYTQVARLIKWLKQHIDGVDSLAKGKLEELLNLDLPKNVRRVIELRALGAQAAAAKADALLQRLGADGRIRGAFVYHAAGPGRWSSRGAQVHNLKRPMTKDLERAIEIIGTGDLAHARKHYDNPLSVIGDTIRGMIIAKPGHTLIGGDFSGIEARVTAWIAGEIDKLDVFRAYDAGTGYDPYIIFAAQALSLDVDDLAARYNVKDPPPLAREQRQVGKAGELAFGFQGGVKAYRRFAPDTELTDLEIDHIKNTWRRMHPRITRFWDNINVAANRAVRDPDSVKSIGNNIQVSMDDAPFMYIMLPSGRQIAYPHARLARAFVNQKTGAVIPHERGYWMLLFKDAAMGQWQETKVYGGLLTENIVQGIARDLLRDAMLRLDAAGYEIVTHVHDECVIEVPLDQVKKVKPKFTELMQEVPEWAEGLPIRISTWVNPRYTK